MPTPLEDELGLGPVMHRVRRWSRNVFSRIGNGAAPDDRRSLDPLTVNYASWHEMRRTVREWPNYKEAANSLEILVSPEDWDDYWGIDTARKEAGVAAYVRARAAEKNYWIAGEPQVVVIPDEAIEIGDVEVVCQFAEPLEDEGLSPLSTTAAHEPLDVQAADKHQAAVTTVLPAKAQSAVTTVLPVGGVDDPAAETDDTKATPTLRFVDAELAGGAYLTDSHGFKLAIQSGDCIGAVVEGEECPPEVNVRLDSDGFPYVESKQCAIGVLDGRWTITNYAYHGTMLVTADGTRLMLGSAEPYPLSEGDVVYLGPNRPLKFGLD